VYQFFFHFRQGDELIPDTLGIEFADVEQAYLGAYKGAQDIWGELLAKRQDPRRCAFEVHDAKGELVFKLPFTELLESCRDSHAVRKIAPLFHETVATATRAKQAAQQFQEELQSVRNNLRESARLLARQI
jgi:hypothetical protein